jgi:hypothetical protein
MQFRVQQVAQNEIFALLGCNAEYSKLRKMRYLPFWDAMKSTASCAKLDICPSGMQ